MGKTIYLECNSGISGDMTVAALLDLGADWEKLQKVLAGVRNILPDGSFQIEKSRVSKAGIDCMDFNVKLDKAHENHDHDMAYLFGHEEHAHEHGHDLDGHHHEQEDHHHTHEQGQDFDEHHHTHEHAHDFDGHHHTHEQGQDFDEHHHTHEHAHDFDEHHHEQDDAHCHSHEHEHGHTHEHRGLTEVNAIIDACQLSDRAGRLAKRIFQILAKAEAKAHGTTPEKVHFHEVGAIDSIVDVIAVAVCLDDLDATEVIFSALSEGCGTIRCQHGILPVPVPAVANILAEYPLSVNFTRQKGELITPTGAAIAAALQTGKKLPKSFTVRGIGYGAGKRAYEKPSILRAMWIEEEGGHETQAEQDVIYKLESNIDDASGELLGYAMQKLFEAGAREVHYHPVYMKKNRPGWQLNVICDKEKISELESIIFRETTTIGIRRQRMERTVLKRESRTIKTTLGEAAVKICDVDGKKRVYPEYESVAGICEKTGLSYPEVMQTVQAEAARQIN